MAKTPAVETKLTLSKRELEILAKYRDTGGTSKELGDELGIDRRTVDFHFDNINGKLGVTKRTKSVIVAEKLGLI